MARIMVIDDEPNIMMVLSEILTDAGHEICTASNGLAGWELMQQKIKPELLLLDLCMPGMNGKEFIQKMSSDPKYRDIPIILITGSVPNKKDFPPAGSYQDFICKPFDIDEVIIKAEKLLHAGKAVY
jgi:CheY-like chemotaxis protein